MFLGLLLVAHNSLKSDNQQTQVHLLQARGTSTADLARNSPDPISFGVMNLLRKITMRGPPLAMRVPHKFTLHGTLVEDHYHWMQAPHGQELRRYLTEENK